VNSALGHTGVLLGLAAAVVGIVVMAVGLARGKDAVVRNAQIYAPVILLGGLIATAAMEHALITHDFSLVYVADNNSRSTPLLYSITGMWSALEGSILLWGVILGGYATAMVWRFRKRGADRLVAWATLVVYVTAAFFFMLMLGPADPFRRVVGAVVTNGNGPNVLLQDNPLVAFHPPMLYLGFVGFTLPFAFAVAALITGRLDEDWQSETRRWTLFAWGFLTAGILLGMWWSYQVLGWGGFWAWDPVENAAFLPWLVGTAYLHSVMVQQRRGLLRVWNLSLVIATFSLTILGTFLTRSGVIQSVHSFSDSTIGPLLIGFFALVLVVGVGLIAWRGDRLRSPGGIDAPLSREGAFLGNNLLFVAFAFVVLLGTVFPLLYQALNNTQVTVGAPYFNALAVPLGLALLFLMGVAPALPWRKTTTAVMRSRLAVPAALAVVTVVACVIGGVHGLEPLVAFGLGAFAAASAGRALVLSIHLAWRSARLAGAGPARATLAGWRGLVGRANGGMVVHIGVVVIAVGLAAATAFGQRGEVRLSPGQTARVDGHTIQFIGYRTVRTPASTAQEAVMRVDGSGDFHPAITTFGSNAANAVGTPSIDSGWRDDVYLTIAKIPSGSAVVIDWVVQPLVTWMWVGGSLLVVGTLLSAVPGRRRRPTDPVSKPVVGVAGTPGPSDEDGDDRLEERAETEPQPEQVPVGIGDRP
jgi:cytochrome c-type biogenesis protein CcmF